MTIDVFTATGTKKGTLTLPKSLFEAPIRMGLMHQAVIMQQSNRRRPIAHAKTRGEVQGSTRKLYKQKGTGRARRGAIRAPLLRGGGKTFGPRSNANFIKEMPKRMRHAALASCLSLQAKQQAIIGLEQYEGAKKTKTLHQLLSKLPVTLGRRILFVTPSRNESLFYSSRNIPGVKAITANYLNPEDVMNARNIIFVADALKVAEETFGPKQRPVISGQKFEDPEKRQAISDKKVLKAKVAKVTKASKSKPKPKS
ncbi:MAG TPA: 50S ribosomal protein L4 [Candidatus Peribacteraceae bacterium]|nr:50S ribosomal protein L4 [Candidatus Peribacteraceae bacterium]